MERCGSHELVGDPQATTEEIDAKIRKFGYILAAPPAPMDCDHGDDRAATPGLIQEQANACSMHHSTTAPQSSGATTSDARSTSSGHPSTCRTLERCKSDEPHMWRTNLDNDFMAASQPKPDPEVDLSLDE